MTVQRAIGLDIGGTKIAGGVVDSTGAVVAEIVEPTPEESDAPAVAAVLLDVVERLRAANRDAGGSDDVVGIGMGAAGIVAWPDGRIVWAPNNAYRDWPVRQQVEAATGLPTVVDNDANVAALAEARLGAQRHQDLLLVTVGTGIGGGLVLGGQIYRGPTGRAGELGHIVLNPDGPVCGCGNHGCFESYASGTALTRMGRDAAADDPDGLIARLAAEQGEVTGETVTAAAQQGDPVAITLFGRLGRWLGVGIASLANIFELEVVAVGGGLVETGDLLLEPARIAVREFAYAPQARAVVPIRAATHGSEAGMIGAALLALEQTIPH